MAKRTIERKILVTGVIAGVTAGALLAGCSSSPSSTATNPDASGSGSADANGSPGPAGATPVTTPPYPICDSVYLGYTTSGAYAVPKTGACATAGAPTTGAADTHCVGQTPQPISSASCSLDDAGSGADTSDAGNAVGSDYGPTMYGTEADDDDCKYHVSYTYTPICENNDTYFIVTATSLTKSEADGGAAPLTGASTYIETFLGDTHPAPNVDGQPPHGNQIVVEGPPGTYTVGPIQFDAPGEWTVRFHFNEFCCDVADDSPHGHAAFYITVP